MKRYAIFIAFIALLIPVAVGAEPTPPAGYSCQFYPAAPCDAAGGGGRCFSYLTISEFPAGNLVYFSDESYGFVVTPLFNSDGLGDGTAIAQGEIYTITETIVPLDDNLPPGTFTMDTPYDVSGTGLYRCYEGEPTPTPSPSPTPTAAPTPYSGSEIEVEWYDSGCESAEIACVSSANPYIYANGLNVGRCISSPLTFNSRPQMTNTIVLFDDAVFTATLDVVCESNIAASWSRPLTPVLDLPTPPPMATDTVGIQAALDGDGFLGLDFGGSLGDPNAPVNRWLGYSTDFIDMVNSGNLLYIIGAIGTAGAVLAWAIHQVRHPGEW